MFKMKFAWICLVWSFVAVSYCATNRSSVFPKTFPSISIRRFVARPGTFKAPTAAATSNLDRRQPAATASASSSSANETTVDPRSLVFPASRSRHFDARYGVEVADGDLELPDSETPADSDLKDHDLMDALMYVYFGANAKDPTARHGRRIVVFGTALGLLLELVVVAVVVSKRRNKLRDAMVVFLHLVSCLFVSNLVFIFNVYVKKGTPQCKIISFSLYYLHIVTACTLCAYTHWVQKLLNSSTPSIRTLLSTTHIGALALYLLSFLDSPESNYEMQRFCFLAIRKSTIIDFIIPICLLIAFTTYTCLRGIRRINKRLDEIGADQPEFEIETKGTAIAAEDWTDAIVQRVRFLKVVRRLLKVLCATQCSYEVVWFFSVLALEYLEDNTATAITYCVLAFLMNIYIFWNLNLFLPNEDAATEYIIVPRPEIDVDVEDSEEDDDDDLPLINDTEHHPVAVEKLSIYVQ